MDKFCNWLLSAENANSTIIAHNQTRYDGSFILQWCSKHGLHPSNTLGLVVESCTWISQNYHLRYIDSCHFFLEPLKKLSSTCNIDTLKGFFPHFFNTPDNQSTSATSLMNTCWCRSHGQKEVYEKDFKPWYDTQVSRNDWSFEENQEMIKCCRADVELLSKAVLKFGR